MEQWVKDLVLSVQFSLAQKIPHARVQEKKNVLLIYSEATTCSYINPNYIETLIV